MEVRDTVQEKGIKTIAKKNKCKKVKKLSEEGLQIAEKRREDKNKEAKGRYTHLNSDFQRKVKRGKKVILSDQCKEIEENNRRGKTRVLFMKIRDTKGTFQARSDQISHSVMSDSLRPHELQHTWPPCPSPTPGVHPDSRPLSH